VVVVIAAMVVSVAGAARPITPSKAAATYALKVEIADHYVEFMDISKAAEKFPDPVAKATVSCDPLTDTLYRCAWMAKQPVFMTAVGKAKVRFYKYAADVTLYDTKCYNAPGAGLDYCAS
jgi:hypothetical protein